MSIPISPCRAIALAKGEGTDVEFERFAQDMAYNTRCGHWSTTGCHHKPACTAPDQAQQDAFNEKLSARIAVINRPVIAADDKRVTEGFKSFTFPVIRNYTAPDFPT